MRIIEIEIKNWNKYNPRSDAKACSWFRMSNSFFTDPDFYGASLEARMIWVFVLSSSSQKMSPKVKINTQMIADNLSIRVESVDFALDELFKIGCITAKDADVIPLRSETLKPEMLDDVTFRNERTNVTNEHNEQTNKYSPSDVIRILNAVCGTAYKLSATSHTRHIQARIKEGHGLQDFASVIKYKNHEWAKNPRMSMYLRPETLFGPKFDSYLQEVNKSVKSESNPTGDPYLAELKEIRKSGETA